MKPSTAAAELEDAQLAELAGAQGCPLRPAGSAPGAALDDLVHLC
ncbi:MAG TPA: hypothetical protein VF526_00120 [Solirubrobacteraceae bacterium]|jgi:hypothetical protein